MNVSMLTERLHRRGLWLFALLVSAALVLSACDLVGSDTEDDEQDQQSMQEQDQQSQQEQQAAPAAAPTAAAQPEQEDEGPEPPPEAAGGGEGATAYSIVFPSLALVLTDQAAATGLVISDGYVMVDERSLGGAMSADVLLSNGDTLEDLPIVGRDQFTGIAYLGPVEGSLVRRLPGARLGDGEGIRPGSSVFTIGYSPADMADATPAVFSGVLSGTEEWEAGRRTFLRTDAQPYGATAGMILVDGGGTVIGIAPAAMVQLGWYVSAGDLARSLPPAAITPARTPDPTSASPEHLLIVDSTQQSTELFLGDDATGQTVSLSITTNAPALLQLIDADSQVLQDSMLIAGSTIISLAPDTVGPYRLLISPEPAMMDDGDEESPAAMAYEPTFEISSSAPLMSMAEADATMPLEINVPFVGTIDVPGDADSFNLALRAGATYEVQVESLLIDTVLLVQGSGLDAVDDDTGGGPFGTDSVLTLEPAADGIVSLTVKDYADAQTGPYVLTVTQTGGEPPAGESAMEDDSAMAMSVTLPTPLGDLSLRGEITQNGLAPTLLGIGSEIGENGSLLVPDNDGIFEIVASIVGTDASTARLFVFDSEGQTVVSGRVILNCTSADPCLASAVFITPEDEPGPAGVWSVLLRPEGAGTGITEWQIEVHLYDDAPEEMEQESEEQ